MNNNNHRFDNLEIDSDIVDSDKEIIKSNSPNLFKLILVHTNIALTSAMFVKGIKDELFQLIFQNIRFLALIFDFDFIIIFLSMFIPVLLTILYEHISRNKNIISNIKDQIKTKNSFRKPQKENSSKKRIIIGMTFSPIAIMLIVGLIIVALPNSKPQKSLYGDIIPVTPLTETTIWIDENTEIEVIPINKSMKAGSSSASYGFFDKPNPDYIKDTGILNRAEIYVYGVTVEQYPNYYGEPIYWAKVLYWYTEGWVNYEKLSEIE